MTAERAECVMLAAGASRRMKSWKMMLPFAGATMIECSVRRALEACPRVVLVSGYRGEELEALFAGWERVECARNERYELGMLSSVQRGAARVRTDRFFIALGDMPLVEPELYRHLLTHSSAEAVIPKYRGKKGHPLLVSRAVRESLLGFDEALTLREVLALFSTLAVPVDSRHILHDIDDRADYEALRPAPGAGGSR
jgi:molybdenum cofactor cytidylyltransferase